MNNLLQRTLSGAGFIVVMLACLLLNQWLFAALVLFMTVTMMLEFYRMSIGKRQRAGQYLALFSGVCLFCLQFAIAGFGLPVHFAALALVPILATMISAIFAKEQGAVADYAYILTGLIYIAAPLSLSNQVAFHGGHFGASLLLCFFILIWCSDIGAYLLGTAFGQKENSRKLAPHISPKKSWVGFWSGMVTCVLAALALRLVGLLDIPVLHGCALAVIVHCGGVCGDLFESLWKRHFGVKDSGNLIPGHGGMLDRFDSTLIAMPLGALYLSLTGYLV